MNGIKAFFLKAGPFGVPVYAYAIGVAALIGGVWYFKTHAGNTGSASVAPQTNYPARPLPYPNPGSGAAGVPPSSAFDTANATSVAQYTPQSNFVPAAAQPTSSAVFAASVQPPISSDSFGQPSPPQASPAQVAAIYNIPIFGSVLSRFIPPPPPSDPAPSTRGQRPVAI